MREMVGESLQDVLSMVHEARFVGLETLHRLFFVLCADLNLDPSIVKIHAFSRRYQMILEHESLQIQEVRKSLNRALAVEWVQVSCYISFHLGLA